MLVHLRSQRSPLCLLRLVRPVRIVYLLLLRQLWSRLLNARGGEVARWWIGAVAAAGLGAGVAARLTSPVVGTGLLGIASAVTVALAQQTLP